MKKRAGVPFKKVVPREASGTLERRGNLGSKANLGEQKQGEKRAHRSDYSKLKGQKTILQGNRGGQGTKKDWGGEGRKSPV